MTTEEKTEQLVDTVHRGLSGALDLTDTVLDTADIVADVNGYFTVSDIIVYLRRLQVELSIAHVQMALGHARKLHIVQDAPYSEPVAVYSPRYQWIAMPRQEGHDAT